MSQTHPFAHQPTRASDIIGTKVINPQDETLGDIKELVIDPYNGRIAYAVVSFGGFLSMGEKLFAIPFSAFDYRATTKAYVLDVPTQRLEDAPGFSPDHWPSLADEKWNREVHRYYGRTPYWE